LRTALEKLKAEGIDTWILSSPAQPAVAGVADRSITKKPARMTDQEAFQHFLAALGFIQPGLWVFTFSVNQ
jgi:hypothetical protein